MVFASTTLPSIDAQFHVDAAHAHRPLEDGDRRHHTAGFALALRTGGNVLADDAPVGGARGV